MLGLPANMFCKSCEYPLQGRCGGVCAECGRKFDPADATSFDLKPRAHRRAWLRRLTWIGGLILVAELLAPSRVARMTWAWPNGDGTTATCETWWCLVSPRWLPVKYPRMRTSRHTKLIEPQGLGFCDANFWKLGWCSVAADGACTLWCPKNSRGGLMEDWMGMLRVAPDNIDRLCDSMLYPQQDSLTLHADEILLRTPADSKPPAK